MNKLIYNLDISEDVLKSMIEINPEILLLSDMEIENKLNILKSIGINDSMLKNIICSNPMYLSRLDEDIILLINKLLTIGFTSINILIDSNPYILNLDDFEIEEYINKRLKDESLDSIVDDLESNPYLFNEI